MTVWCDAETAVQVVESGNNIFLQGMSLTPTPLIDALVARGEELRNVELLHGTHFWPRPIHGPTLGGALSRERVLRRNERTARRQRRARQLHPHISFQHS